MDIRKRNSLLALGLGGFTFLTGFGMSVYSSKQLEKIPSAVERTFEIEERTSQIDKELRSAITRYLEELSQPGSSLSRIIEEDKYGTQLLTQEQINLNQQYKRLMKRDDIIKGRNDRNRLLEYKNWGVYIGLIGTIPFGLGLYGTLSYLTTKRKRSNLVRSILTKGIPEEELENKVM